MLGSSDQACTGAQQHPKRKPEIYQLGYFTLHYEDWTSESQGGREGEPVWSPSPAGSGAGSSGHTHAGAAQDLLRCPAQHGISSSRQPAQEGAWMERTLSSLAGAAVGYGLFAGPHQLCSRWHGWPGGVLHPRAPGRPGGSWPKPLLLLHHGTSPSPLPSQPSPWDHATFLLERQLPASRSLDPCIPYTFEIVGLIV